MATETIETTENCRHVFLYYKNRISWPPCFESSDADPLTKLFISTWKGRKDNMTVKTKIAVCEVDKGSDFSDGDVLIFPEMIKYRGLVESNVVSFFEDVLVFSKPWSAGIVPEVLTGSYIYVCARRNHDVRRDDSVSYFIGSFKMEIRLRRPYNEIYVTACCHVGGHDYAGNALIYSPGPDGKTVGHWCAYGSPDDVLHRLDQHIPKIERDQVKPSVAKVKGADDQKLANGEDTNKGKNNQIDIRAAIGLLGVVAAAVAVAYIS